MNTSPCAHFSIRKILGPANRGEAGTSHHHRQSSRDYRTLSHRSLYELRLSDHKAMQSNADQALRASEANK